MYSADPSAAISKSYNDTMLAWLPMRPSTLASRTVPSGSDRTASGLTKESANSRSHFVSVPRYLLFRPPSPNLRSTAYRPANLSPGRSSAGPAIDPSFLDGQVTQDL